jgi:hypothetical protein
MFKIQTNIPAPTGSTKGAKRKYPFDKMSVGDSFFVAVDGTNTVIKIQGTLASCARAFYGAAGFLKTCGVQEDGVKGVRVWRIK